MTQDSWNFSYEAPTQIKFGWGAIENIAEYVSGYASILLLCGRTSAQRTGLLNRVLNLLSDKKVCVYDEVSPNPRVEEINSAAALGAENNVTIVIGLGGGSVMDAAKATAAAIGGGHPVEHYLRKGLEAPALTLPVIAIPTTAGTGSETSMGAIISDEAYKEKKGLRGKALLPKVAIVDPELTMTVPLTVTAETGFDIFTHAMETYISIKSSEMTKIYSIKAIEIVLDYLPILVRNLNDRDARTELSFASMLMGYNLMHAGTCLPHRLQYPLGAHTDCSHPAGLVALYPSWCRNTAPFAMEKFDQVARLFEERGYKSDGGEGGEYVAEYLCTFFDCVGIQTRISALGLAEETLEILPDEVSGSLAADPGNTSREALLKIYKESW